MCFLVSILCIISYIFTVVTHNNISSISLCILQISFSEIQLLKFLPFNVLHFFHCESLIKTFNFEPIQVLLFFGVTCHQENQVQLFQFFLKHSNWLQTFEIPHSTNIFVKETKSFGSILSPIATSWSHTSCMCIA
jgi:hypothetical protein